MRCCNDLCLLCKQNLSADINSHIFPGFMCDSIFGENNPWVAEYPYSFYIGKYIIHFSFDSNSKLLNDPRWNFQGCSARVLNISNMEWEKTQNQYIEYLSLCYKMWQTKQ